MPLRTLRDPGGVAQTGKGVKTVYQSEGSFKDRVLARSRWPESKNVDDRRGIDIRKDYTIDEWVNRREAKPM